MWRDVERRAERLGLPFHRPDLEKGGLFPQNGLAAARIAMVGLEADWGRDFCRSVYRAQFAEGRDISDPDLLGDLARSAGAVDLDLEASMGEGNKSALRAQTERAMEQGIFGAPSFIVKDELFWGDDRLEDAVAWAARGR